MEAIFQESELLLQMSQLFKVFGDVTCFKIIALLYEKQEMTNRRNRIFYGNGTIGNFPSTSKIKIQSYCQIKKSWKISLVFLR